MMPVCLVDHRIKTTAAHVAEYFLDLKERKIEADNEGQRLTCCWTSSGT